MLLPLMQALVVVSKSDAVRAVSHPVHDAKSCVVEEVLAQVIFQYDSRTRDTRGFAEELCDVRGVMEDIHEEAGVEGAIGEREMLAVESAAGNATTGARNDFDAFDGDVRAALGEESADGTVAAANVEDASALRKKRREGFGQDLRAASKNQSAMAAGDPGEGPGLRGGSHRFGRRWWVSLNF